VIDQSQAQQLMGQTLHTSDGDKAGKIGQVYLDAHNGQPEWITVNTGLFGTSESFVPLAEASLTADGVNVPYTKATIKDAPNIDDAGQLSEAQERELYDYYGISYTTEGSTFADTTRTSTTRTSTTGTAGYAGTAQYAETSNAHGTTGYDTSGPTTDSAMTRSEEELHVGTERVQAGKARLRKWVETENVSVDVPIRTEKAVLVTEPITDANRGDAFDGPAISEEEHEVILTTERPVVSKETVPVERVRLDTQVVENVETVSDQVRKEHIELEGDVDTTGTTGTTGTNLQGKKKR